MVPAYIWISIIRIYQKVRVREIVQNAYRCYNTINNIQDFYNDDDQNIIKWIPLCDLNNLIIFHKYNNSLLYSKKSF